jgi:Arc/MetJ family transcription regulator
MRRDLLHLTAVLVGCIRMLYARRMRTTLDIDRELLNDAVLVLGVTTKREAIETALRESIQARRRAQLVAALGTFDLCLTAEELEQQREDE